LGEVKTKFRTAADALTLGLTFPACILAGYFLGKGADRLFGFAPYASYIGGVLGILAGFWNLFQIARKAESDDRGDGQ